MRKLFMISLLQSNKMVSMQAIDYWPLANIFQLIARFLAPFLSHKDLVSRRLREKQGLNEFAEEIAEFESSKIANMRRQVLAHSHQACTQQGNPAPTVKKGGKRFCAKTTKEARGWWDAKVLPDWQRGDSEFFRHAAPEDWN